MNDWSTKSAKDILAEASELANKIHEHQSMNPPTYHFVRASDDANPVWRDNMTRMGWVRREVESGLCEVVWVKDFFEPIGVIPDACFPEDKDGKRVAVLSIRQLSNGDQIPSLEIPKLKHEFPNYGSIVGTGITKVTI